MQPRTEDREEGSNYFKRLIILRAIIMEWLRTAVNLIQLVNPVQVHAIPFNPLDKADHPTWMRTSVVPSTMLFDDLWELSSGPRLRRGVKGGA